MPDLPVLTTRTGRREESPQEGKGQSDLHELKRAAISNGDLEREMYIVIHIHIYITIDKTNIYIYI